MNFTLNVLGTASALPTTERYPSAQVLNVRGRLFMFDCGEGAQIGLRRAGVSFLKIEHICLTHNHGDHIFGIFGLLSTMGLLGRTSALNLYAPESFRTVLEFFKVNFGEGLLFDIVFHPLTMTQPEVIWETRNMELLAFPMNHRVDTYGYMVREKMPAYNIYKEAISRYGLTLSEIGTLKRGEDVMRETEGGVEVIPLSDAAYIPYQPRSYAYCSDTAPFPDLAEWINGVTLLYHEATFPAEMSEMAEKTFHSTTLQAASLARDAGVGKLIVGHYSSRYPDVGFFLEEIRQIFPSAELAHDGSQYEIPLTKHTHN